MRARHASSIAILAALVVAPSVASAGPPSGPHPRLFMSANELAGYTANVGQHASAAAALVAACQDTLDEPNQYASRGGSDGNYWPGSAVACAFAYLATQNDAYRTQALKYWHASLDDDQTLGDGKGCVAGVDTNWQSWDGNPPAPPVILTVTHDTGYPMRWYAPFIALTYDWLNSTSGVDASLLSQTRTCLTAWSDYYTANGYHAIEAGANYNAGYVIGKTLSAIAIGTDGGADGHLWTETTDDVFATLLIGQGLSGASGGVGDPAGVMVGGDWGEGWEYGPLSVLEYAVAARAVEENGQALPDMDAWVDSLAVRYAYATLPDLSGQWVGGDFDDTAVYAAPSVNEVDAVLAGSSSDAAASFAAFLKQAQSQSAGAGAYVYNAFAELRSVAPADFRAQSPAPSRWYLARGTRALYARTSWDDSALWSVFSSAPSVVSDHEHFSASNFVLSRGVDHLVVDPSNYGEYDSLATNAVSVDSSDAQGDYIGTQTPWSEAELVWARGTDDAVYAARSDLANAFIYVNPPTDIPYAHREWVFLPEGEVVTVDRVHTVDAAHEMHVRFHTNTGHGGLALANGAYRATVGGSDLAIHTVLASGGAPNVVQPEVGDCSISCSYPCGQCDAARFPVDEYQLDVPGPEAVAVHVIDALAAGSSPAVVGSMNDDTIDPAPKQNGGVLGAAVFSGSKQTYVVASSAADGASPQTMTYGVPGDSPSRHVVYDAPEAGDGQSLVAAAAMGGRCVITITAGEGFTGHPLMFSVDSAANGCTPTDSTDVGPGMPPGTGGGSSTGTATSTGAHMTGAGGGGPGATSGTSMGSGTSSGGAGGADGDSATPGADSGCGCVVAGERQGSRAPLTLSFALAIALSALARRRRASR
jgi:hypothetical protein